MELNAVNGEIFLDNLLNPVVLNDNQTARLRWRGRLITVGMMAGCALFPHFLNGVSTLFKMPASEWMKAAYPAGYLGASSGIVILTYDFFFDFPITTKALFYQSLGMTTIVVAGIFRNMEHASQISKVRAGIGMVAGFLTCTSLEFMMDFIMRRAGNAG